MRTLVRQSHTPGAHTAVWDGRDDAGLPVASGTYYCRILCGPENRTAKFVYLR